MVARSAAAIERALLRKGFRYRDSHHKLLNHFVGPVSSGIVTRISHSGSDYGDELLALMSRQLHLSKAELLQLIDCEMSGEDYLLLMQERGVIR